MKNDLRLWIFGLFVLVLAVSFVSADTIEPGHKYVNYCSKFTNLNDFPDYIFLNYNHGPMGEGIVFIENNKCVYTGYKFSENSVYAIEKSKFSQEALTFGVQWGLLNNSEREEYEKRYGENLGYYKDFIASEVYINKNKNLIPLNVTLNHDRYISAYSPLSGITNRLTVNLENGNFRITSREDKNYASAGLLIIILPILAAIGIVIVIMGRKK